MAQQTAIEYIEKYMINHFHLTPEALFEFRQAKKMEREKIEVAYKSGLVDGAAPFMGEDCLFDSPSDYYISKFIK